MVSSLTPHLATGCLQELGTEAHEVREDLSEALANLCRAVATIDRLWNEARDGADELGLAMALGEASQGAHRALSALGNQAPRLGRYPRALGDVVGGG